MSVNKKRILKRIFCTSFSVFCLLFIFSQSLLSSKDSSAESSKILETLNYICDSLNLSFSFSMLFVRKFAHFFEFAVLGFSLRYTMHSYIEKRAVANIFVVIIYVTVAISDECLQLFSMGRACSAIDMIIDSIGGTFGFLIAVIIAFIITKISECKSKQLRG